MMTPRAAALKLLFDWENNEKYANLSLQSPLIASMSEQDRAFVTTLFYTTIERKITLDYYIGALADRSAQELSAHTRMLLRLGLCQLMYLDRIPKHAVVSETVELASHIGERRLVNAVLRRATRSLHEIALPPKDKKYVRYLSVAYSFPQPLVKRLLEEVGEGTEALLRAFNRTAPLTLTVNTTRTTREALLAALSECGIEACPTEHAPRGIRVMTEISPTRLYGYGEGLFFVQDEASQLQCAVLDAPQGARVMDVCAAPGGKSLAAAISMGDTGEVLSFDLHESKCSLIQSSADRLGLSCIRVCARDAREPDEALLGTADRVICDVPCSGLGVLGKKADLRYKDLSTVDRLPTLALSILSASAGYVKDGGVLVYSTCTVTQSENRAVVDAFLRTHPDFSLEPFSVCGIDGEDGTRTLYPHTDGTDGFYIAKLRRTLAQRNDT